MSSGGLSPCPRFVSCRSASQAKAPGLAVTGSHCFGLSHRPTSGPVAAARCQALYTASTWPRDPGDEAVRPQPQVHGLRAEERPIPKQKQVQDTRWPSAPVLCGCGKDQCVCGWLSAGRVGSGAGSRVGAGEFSSCLQGKAVPGGEEPRGGPAALTGALQARVLPQRLCGKPCVARPSEHGDSVARA